MKSQFKKQYPVLMTMTFASLLMLSATPVQAADKSASCERAQSTYRAGAPGKGTIRKQDCDRVEFSAFELGSTKQQETGFEDFEDMDTVKVGKPTYNRRPINR